MGRIVVSDNVSLDGVIQDPAGDEGFTRGGWVGAIKDRREVNLLTLDEALRAEALLLGRRSYQWLAARWPSRTGELADRINSLPKYIVSSTLENPTWMDATVLRGNVFNEVSKLKQQRSLGQLHARAHTDGTRSRRRVEAEDLSGRARGRRTAVRRHQRQDTYAPCRRPGCRWRHRLPHLPARQRFLARPESRHGPTHTRFHQDVIPKLG
jgi:dihydrofolate reductase